MKNIKSGNLDKFFKLNPKTRGWFLGAYVNKKSPFNKKEFEIKWSLHKKNEEKKTESITDTETLTILLQGKFIISLSKPKKQFYLKKPGDYVYFGKGIKHTWKCKENARMLTVRWPSLSR